MGTWKTKMTFLRAICVGMFVLGFFFVFLPVFAASTSDLSDQLKEINGKIKAYQDIIDIKRSQGVNLATQIESLEAQAGKLELEIEKNKVELGEVTVMIDEKERIISLQKSALSDLVREYREYRQKSDGETLLAGSRDVPMNIFFKEDDWMTETSDRIRRLMESIRQEKAVLESKRIEADTLREQLGERNAYLESAKESKTVLLAKTVSDQKKYSSLVVSLEEERERIQDEIESLEAGKIEGLDLKDIPSFKKGLLSYPVKDPRVTQGYGATSFARTSGMYKNGFHNGYDFGLSVGSSVLAADDGKVIATGNNGRYAYGRWMAVDHGNGLVTMYGHLSSIKESRGKKVEKGDVIAKSGNTGNSTGPHLHFSVFSAKTFEIVPSTVVLSLKDIPVGATVSPGKYLP